MKNDFFYNLDIIKDLEDACRKAEASREAESRKVKLLQVRVSDEVIKLKRQYDQFELCRQQLETCRKENDTNRFVSTVIT